MLRLQVAAAGLTLPAVLAARAMVGLGEGVALPRYLRTDDAFMLAAACNRLRFS